MNKIVIGGLAVAGIALVAWLVLTPSDMAMEQQFTFDEEVAELEAELVAVEAAVAAGNLTPQDAAAAQTRISTRLEAITGITTQAQTSTTLTTAQRTQLEEGLSRLQNILVSYRATLQVVDEQSLTLPEAERPQLFRGRTSVQEAFEAAVVEVDTALGGSAPQVQMEEAVEVEADAGTVIEVGEMEVVEENEVESEEGMEVEAELQGEVELEPATSS